MIKINLLPFRAARKRENIRRQISIYIATIVILAAALFIYSFITPDLFGQLNKLKEEEKDLKAELGKHQRTLNAIKKLQKRINEIETKLNVIKKLEEGKTGPVLLLDEIAEAVPRDKLWLKSLRESGGSLTLTGTAMDNATVALFMDNLKNSEHISNVDLKSAKLRDLKQYRLKVSDFVLQCKTYAKEEKEKPKKGKKKGR